jgi:hypothetical protein
VVEVVVEMLEVVEVLVDIKNQIIYLLQVIQVIQ